MTVAAADILPDAPDLATALRLPPRRADSIRRTLSLDGCRQEGRAGPFLIAARGRDLRTPPAPAAPAAPEILTEDTLRVRLSPDKIIEALDASPAADGLEDLIGRSSLRGFRAALAATPGLGAIAGRPLRVLLDDLVGLSIIEGAVWLHWSSNGQPPGPPPPDRRPPVGTCLGFRPGSSALTARHAPEETVFVPPLETGGDPYAFHPGLVDDAGPSVRRLRCIDVWRDGDLHIHALFQDSVTLPDGRRAGVHAYALRATADARTHRLTAIAATPTLLPHRECFDGPASLHGLIGLPLPELRDTVPGLLRGIAGCTHLNDAARALTEAAILLRLLPAA